MTIRASDATFVPSLLEFFESLGCRAVQEGADLVDVDLRETIDADQGRLLIALFLSAWRVKVLGVKVEIRDPSIAPELVGYIERMGFVAFPLSSDTIEVFPGEPMPELAARLELDLYLCLWRVINERHDVTLAPP